MNNQKAFNPGQMYTALSRVASLSGKFLTGYFDKPSIRANKKAKHEYCAEIVFCSPLKSMKYQTIH